MLKLTHPQKRIMINQQIYEDSKFAYMYGLVRIDNVNSSQMQDAINDCINYFDCLRIRFVKIKKEILQYVESFEAEEIEIKDINFDFHSVTFHLFHEKLYKFYILIENESIIGYYFILHHAIADAYTITLITKYINDNLTHKAFIPKRSFINFTEAENQYLTSDKMKENRHFFANMLRQSKNFKYVPEFKLRCERITLSFSKEESNRILAFCKYKGISVFKLFYTSLFLYFYMENGFEYQTICTTHHNRHTDELLQTGGMLTSTVLVAQKIDLSMTFHEFLKDSTDTITKCLLRHQYPIDILISEHNHEDCFDLNFNEVSFNSIPFGDKEIDIERFSPSEDISKYNFKLNPNSRPKGNNIELALDYRLSNCGRKHAEHILETIKSILFHFIENENKLVSDILAGPKDIVIELEKVFSANESKTALICREESLTYGELNSYINSVAQFAKSSTQIVGVENKRCIWYVAAILGILKAGKAFVVIDFKLPQKRLKNMIAQTKIKHLLVFDDTTGCTLPVKTINLHKLPSVKDNYKVLVNELAYILFTSGTTGTPKGVMVSRKGLLAFCEAMNKLNVYESGKNITAFCDFNFDFSLGEIFLTLYGGGTLHILSDDISSDTIVSQSISNDAIVSQSISNDIGVSQCMYNDTNASQCTYDDTKVPKHMNNNAKVSQFIRKDIYLLHEYFIHNDIKHVFLPTRTGEAYMRRFCVSPIESLTVLGERMTFYQKTSYKVYNVYGPTEFTIASHIGRIQEEAREYSFGNAFPEILESVVDENGNESSKGELLLWGKQAALGYLNDYAMTDKKFFHVYNDKDGTFLPGFRTGDLVERTKDGLIFISRIDRQIKHNGYRINIDEIEIAARACEYVHDSVCIYHKNSIILYVVPKTGYHKDGLYEHLKYELPEYELPHIIKECDLIPQNINGKTDYKALLETSSSFTKNVYDKEPFRHNLNLVDVKSKDNALSENNSNKNGIYLQTELKNDDKQLGRESDKIRARILNILNIYSKNGKIDSNTSLSTAGLDSIDIIQVILAIEQEFKFSLKFMDFLLYPTAADLAKRLSREIQKIPDTIGVSYLYDKKPKVSYIVKVKKGKGIPVIMIFDMTGDVIAYKNLINSIGNRPVFFMIFKGDKALLKDNMNENFAEMPYAGAFQQNKSGSCFQAELKKISLKDYCRIAAQDLHKYKEYECYDIIGYSSGGIFALELARWMNKAVNHVFMIDTPNYKKYPKRLGKIVSLSLTNMVFIIKMHGLKDLIHYINGRMKLIRQKRVIWDDQLKIIEMVKNADIYHTLKNTTLIASSKLVSQTDKRLGWGTAIKRNNIVYLKGNHITIMDKENTKKIGKIINKGV